ncbi:MAG: DUF2283 domain-containing protein [Archaeoglobaceae archaeon]
MNHIIRAVYEYDGKTPVVITVYFPYADRYYMGGGCFEDKISADSDILLIKFGEGVHVDSLDTTEGLIAHFREDGKLLEIEVLDASKFVDINELNFSFEDISALRHRIKEARV